MFIHRRHFLKSSLASSALVSIGGVTIPTFLARSAKAAAERDESGRILVVVQLIGGNDGLNTVVPHRIDGYARNRRRLRLPSSQLHPINDEIALHPSLGGLARVLEDGRLAIAHGVGYPNPDRSHFRSMEIWETARTENSPEALATGWIGRALDAHPPQAGQDAPALHLGGGRLPLACRSKHVEVPSIERIDQFRLQVEGSAAERRAARTGIQDLARLDRPADDPLLGFLTRSALTAYESSRRLEQLEASSDEDGYPNFELARRLRQIARIIKAGFGTHIYYTRQGGYDTHANQLGTHAVLLNELGDALAAFLDDLKSAGEADRVSVLVFSEFGRRVRENASNGTDHGAAAPVFLAGPVKTPGLIGAHPSLEDLDDGDLKFHTDFRRLYASLLEDWLGLEAGPVVGPEFEPLPGLLPS